MLLLLLEFSDRHQVPLTVTSSDIEAVSTLRIQLQFYQISVAAVHWCYFSVLFCKFEIHLMMVTDLFNYYVLVFCKELNFLLHICTHILDLKVKLSWTWDFWYRNVRLWCILRRFLTMLILKCHSVLMFHVRPRWCSTICGGCDFRVINVVRWKQDVIML